MANVVIIGSGPAGISASLYLARAGIKTSVISKGTGALKKADQIENYYGFSQSVSGDDLHSSGVEGAKKLGVEMIEEEVVGINFEDKLVIKTNKNDYKADGVLIATGTQRTTPRIKNLVDFEGKGVSYCAVCDAFFYRGRDVSVIGNGEYALHEAIELAAVANSVTILTNGSEPTVEFPENMKVNKNPIKSIEGTQLVEKVVFNDETALSTDGVFIALGIAGSTDLAKKIGAEINGNKIVVDETMATNIPGLYAAGDCTGGLLQISKAVYEGAKAGTEMIKFIRANNS